MSILLTEHQGTVLTLTLNRPEFRNALSAELARALAAAVGNAGNETRCIVLRGTQGAFCAGMDLKERRTLDADGKWEQAQSLRDLTAVVMASPRPVIAAISGWCLGGGFELALSCDLRVAAADATFGFPEMTLGAYPGGGAAVLVPRVAGIAAAKRLMFATDRINATEAHRLGLVDWLVPAEDMEATLLTIERAIARRSPLALAALKPVLDRVNEMPYGEAAALAPAPPPPP
jgi:enoyl-CoA hydratase/carnithine racemase